MRYSHISSKGNRESRYSPRRALARLKELATMGEMAWEPLPCHGFFEYLFQALRLRIDGDLVPPAFPFRYVSAHEEGTVAVVSLLYASLRRRVSRLDVRVDNAENYFRIHFCGTPIGEKDGLVFLVGDGEAKSTFALLRAVAKNSGISLSYVVDEKITVSLCFARYIAEVQAVGSSDAECKARVHGYLSHFSSLFCRSFL